MVLEEKNQLLDRICTNQILMSPGWVLGLRPQNTAPRIQQGGRNHDRWFQFKRMGSWANKGGHVQKGIFAGFLTVHRRWACYAACPIGPGGHRSSEELGGLLNAEQAGSKRPIVCCPCRFGVCWNPTCIWMSWGESSQPTCPTVSGGDFIDGIAVIPS